MRCCHLHLLLPQPWVSFLARLLAISSVPIFSLAGAMPPTLSVANPLPLTATHPTSVGGQPTLAGPPPVSADQAMVLSSALPPLSAKVVGKIKSGQYVAMKDLLADNMHTVGGTPRASWNVFRFRKAAAAGNSVSSDMGVLLPSLCCSAHPGQQDPQPPHLWAAGGEGGPAAWWPRMAGIRHNLPAACCTGPIGAVERAQP